MNNVCLIGRLTKTPELRSTESGKKVCQFSIAVRRDTENADFINCVVWNQAAENLCKYQNKGSLISVVGSIRTSNYEKDGKTYNKVDVLANQIHYLESKKQEPKEEPKEVEDFNEIVLTDDDLPF